MATNTTYLLLEWFNMILVDVSITDRVHEFARLQSAHMRDHVCQQRIACNVEWNTETLEPI